MNRFGFSRLMLVLGLLFIYAPMLILVIYSFNASKLVTVWGGWSVKWYVGLLDNTQLMGSVVRSLEIACYTAIAAVVLGTLAAFVLTRVTRFKGRTLFGGLVTAPLVMPEVITGLSLLLLFVAMAQLIGWPQERGLVTIWIAHTTFCAAYVAVVVSARLRELDLSIEEAAMDLGARPWKVFFLITIPMIAPSLGAGGMLSPSIDNDKIALTGELASTISCPPVPSRSSSQSAAAIWRLSQLWMNWLAAAISRWMSASSVAGNGFAPVCSQALTSANVVRSPKAICSNSRNKIERNALTRRALRTRRGRDGDAVAAPPPRPPRDRCVLCGERLSFSRCRCW